MVLWERLGKLNFTANQGPNLCITEKLALMAYDEIYS